MKAIGAIWINTLDDNFTGQLIGIVLGEDDVTKQKKAYIGVGDGADEAVDVDRISKQGGKITEVEVRQLAIHFGLI